MTPPALGNLSRLATLPLNGNSLGGCIPATLRDVAQNDLASLGLPSCTAQRRHPRVGWLAQGQYNRRLPGSAALGNGRAGATWAQRTDLDAGV